jgi:hypothetical protein
MRSRARALFTREGWARRTFSPPGGTGSAPGSGCAQWQILNGLFGIGFSHTIGARLTFNLGVNFATLVWAIPPIQPDAAERHPNLGIGSVHLNGTRTSPLLQLHLRKRISLDFDAGLFSDLTASPARTSIRYALAGFSSRLQPRAFEPVLISHHCAPAGRVR